MVVTACSEVAPCWMNFCGRFKRLPGSRETFVKLDINFGGGENISWLS